MLPSFPAYVWETVNQRVPRREKANYREDGDFIIAYNINVVGRTFIALNKTAGLIYQLCDGKHTLGDIVQALRQKYPDISLEQLTYDTHQCIRSLELKRLVTVVKKEFLGPSASHISEECL